MDNMAKLLYEMRRNTSDKTFVPVVMDCPYDSRYVYFGFMNASKHSLFKDPGASVLIEDMLQDVPLDLDDGYRVCDDMYKIGLDILPSNTEKWPDHYL